MSKKITISISNHLFDTYLYNIYNRSEWIENACHEMIINESKDLSDYNAKLMIAYNKIKEQEEKITHLNHMVEKQKKEIEELKKPVMPEEDFSYLEDRNHWMWKHEHNRDLERERKLKELEEKNGNQ